MPVTLKSMGQHLFYMPHFKGGHHLIKSGLEMTIQFSQMNDMNMIGIYLLKIHFTVHTV